MVLYMKTARQLERKQKLTPLRRSRTRFGLSQFAVAEMVGVEPSFMSLLEAGKRKPSLDVAQRLAKFYETTVEELFP